MLFKKVRTDLAIESHEILINSSNADDNLNGINVEEEGNITRVYVTNEEGEKKIGKSKGSYITIDTGDIKYLLDREKKELSKVVANEISKVLNTGKTVLVVGLGNADITPDSLGPKVASKIAVTRHFSEYMPEDMKIVSAIVPGVFATTGVETGDIVKGVADKVKPDCIIAVDSLAARNTNRVNSTIQISNTGLNPGGGVANRRQGITLYTMGIPVIAIGVPTVVDAATIASDTLDSVLDMLIKESEKDSDIYKSLNNIDREEKYEIIKEAIYPKDDIFMVTPKGIDEEVEIMADIISQGINIALNGDCGINIIEKMLQ